MTSDRRFAATIADDDAPAEAKVARGDGASLGRGSAFGRYIVLDLLGEGGMGIVYAAYDPELDRKLAVKVLRDEALAGGSTDRRARLLREGQALARLGHPNVVTVYDVGTLGDQVFIAMELVTGRTVSAWLAEGPRGWKEIVELYRQAGRGLAAAHALGIVHRDFKPDNVLLDDNGRVRVVDFGLAVVAEDDPDAPSRAPVAPEWERGAQLAISLTRTGAIVGTPGYIAPEGGARPGVDQFAFCVALWRALHGELPFAGASATELTAAAVRGELREPVRRIPAWLHRALLRGLAADPAQRFPSMDNLVDVLGKTSRGTAIAALIAVPLVAAAAIALVAGHEPSQLCRGADRQLARVWDRGAIARAFAATKLPYADLAARGVDAVLDRYAGAWVTMRTEACEATRIRGEQSEDLLDLRMACLDDRSSELRALADVFAHADAKVVERSAAAANALRPIADCADAAALKVPVKPPANPIMRLRVQALRDEVAEARALDRAGKFDAAIARAAPLVAPAHALAYRPLEASVLTVLGIARNHAAKHEEAQAALESAVDAAIAARDNAIAAEAGASLVQVIGFDRAKLAEAEQWIARTRAFLEAQPNDRLSVDLDNSVGNVRQEASRYDDAIELHTHALATLEKQSLGRSVTAAIVTDNLGNDYLFKGNPAKSTEYHRRALDLEIELLGGTHPRVALTLTNLGASLMDEGKLDEARDAEQRAVAIKEVVYGKDSMMVGASVHELANVYQLEGNYPLAEAGFRRVAAIYKRELGPDHPRVANSVASLAGALFPQHKLDEAESLHKEALGIRIKAFGPVAHDLVNSYVGLSQIAGERGHWDEALGYAQHALEIKTKIQGANSPGLAETLTYVGNAQLGAGRAAKALEAYTTAIKLAAANKDADPVDRADTRFGLAKALWETGDHAQARKIAGEVEQVTRGTAAQAKELHPLIEAWIAAHP